MTQTTDRSRWQRLPLWLAALWWGSLSATGFWVVPLLFVNLPTPAMAGTMAAKLFSAQTWVAVVCGMGLLLAGTAHQRDATGAPQQAEIKASAQLTLGFVALGMLLALLSEFAVSPRIVARENLALWHGLGSGMYLLQWVCAGVVFWRLGHAPRVA
jgi:Domain of unknown function (DUF4149)